MHSAKELDKYYTKSDVVEKCINSIHESLDKYDFIIEPSAGDGAFFKQIKSKNKLGVDIAPENKKIKKANFLKLKLDKEYKKILIIGNPPFGINHSLSTAFLEYSFNFKDVKTIGFILPNVYKKHTRQKIIPNNWRIKKIVDLGKNAFSFNGNTRHVPCSFFIFDKSKGKDLRVDVNKHKKTKDFEFGNKKDFDLFIFGASPKKMTFNPKPNNRGYFLKSKISTKKIIKNIQEINWKGNSCANGGVFWLTKYELLEQYNNYISK